MARAIQIGGSDNIATMLDACAAGQEIVVSRDGPELRLLATEAIPEGHKVAVTEILEGGAAIKFATEIGRVLRRIPRGAWVHLHNLASGVDERSGSLDGASGAPTDTVYR